MANFVAAQHSVGLAAGNVKKAGVLLVTFLSFFLFSCALGQPAKQIPRHLSAGGREMKKGLVWYQKGCYGRSLEFFLRAHELYSASDVLDGVAMSLNNIGTIYRITGNYEKALSFFDASFAIHSDLNDQEGAVKALSNKAATFIRAGELDKAEQVLEEAMQMFPAGAKDRLLVPILQNKGVLLTKREAYEAAEEILTDCLKQARSLDPMGMASLHFAFGNLMLESGRPGDAIASFQKALSIDRELGFFRGIADDLFSMGHAYAKLGQDEKAISSWKRSAKVFALIDQAPEAHTTMKILTETARRAGVDISVTKAFVERWQKHGLYESPCRD
ncbi:MAG: tetratricopeptide repeat protein [Desulfobacterales bacterium]|nr:MAG: tetratricopeptide repeat protein [Desulfobacterales bacterium]